MDENMKFKTEDELKAFVKKVKSCSTWEELGKAVHKSAKEVRWIVYGIRSKYGPEACPLLEQRKRADRRQRAVELRKEGVLHAKDIAKKIGVSTATVCLWLREELGEDWQSKVPKHKSSEDVKRTKEIMRMRESLSGAEIARRLGMKRQRVHQIVQREMERRGMSGPAFVRGASATSVERRTT